MIFTDKKFYHEKLASQGKLMALDVGTKRIGVATCNELRIFVTPKTIINRKSDAVDFAKIRDLIKEENFAAIIIGFPTHMDGKRVEMSDFVEKFAKNLDDFLGQKLPIFFADERLSSFEAQERAREIPSRKKLKHFDDIAAAVILEEFLAAV